MANNGKTQFAILGMLGLLKKSSGYNLKKHMEASTQYFWKESFSSIYPVLEELEKKKLIVEVEKTKKNNRTSNVYALTSKGRTTLKNWLKQPAENMQMRSELMLKLFFGTMVPFEVNIEHLEQQKKELEKKRATYQEIKKTLANDNLFESLYSLITLDHGIRQASTSLEWCDNAIRTLQSVKHHIME